LSVLDHEGNQPIDDLKEKGARTYQSAKELASHNDVVILCVTGSPQVEVVLAGEDGVLKGMRPGTIIIDCSTAVPTSTERLAQQVLQQGGRFLDAPMTRTPIEAAEGRLNLLVGGDIQLFEECKPILSCFAENIVHIGGIGAGHRMKLLHKYVSLGMVTLLAEASACAQTAGINTQTFVDVLAMGGGWGAPLERLKPFLTNGDSTGLRFSIANAVKDLTYYNTMAQDARADRTIADAVKRTLALACQETNPQDLLPNIISAIAKRKI